MDYVYLFDDAWWMAVWHNFSFMMIAIPAFLGALLKLIAKLHPNVPCDEIMGLFQVWFSKPGTVTQTTSTTSKTETHTETRATDKAKE